MARIRETQLVKAIGEYIVSAELCRRGLIATPFAGNMPEFDILAMNKDNKAIQVQVKTKKNGDWQLDAGKYLNIKFEELTDKQSIEGEKALPYPYLIYVFVDVMGDGGYEFYILGVKKLQEIIHEIYESEIIVKHK